MAQLETNVNKKGINLKVVLSVVGIIVLLIVSYSIGSGTASTKIDEEKVTYNKLLEKIEKLETERDEVSNNIGKQEQQLKDKESEYSEVIKMIEQKDLIQKDIDSLNNDVTTKKDEINKLVGEIETKNKELALVTAQIKEKKMEPKNLSAGKFTVGKDVIAGRYKVIPNGSGGNFFVNDGMKANIMLGRGDFYVSEYVIELIDSDEIDATLPIKLIPIE